MSLYLKVKKLDVETGDPAVVLIHSQDSERSGLRAGNKVWLNLEKHPIVALVNVSDTEIEPGYVGLYREIWSKYLIPSEEIISLDLITRPLSVDFIAQKIIGHKLNKEQMYQIIYDISEQKMRESEMVYFMSTMFNPGFDEEETVFAIQAMAKYGDNLNFKEIGSKKAIIADKHSIGGIPSKGVTPLLVPIIASFDINIPNTSTRAITSAAGTSDLLEVLMPVELPREKVMETVEKTSACMIWGGNLRLAPAADVLIKAEKELHLESFRKLMISIVAKKLAMGITHVLIDIPYGENAKVKKLEDLEKLSVNFRKYFEVVGIKCEVYKREVISPDGNGIGPALEAIDVLKILERAEDRSKPLEELVLDMAGRLLELCGIFEKGLGKEEARKKLESGDVAKKFWDIALSQGAEGIKKATDIKVGTYTKEILAPKSGTIKKINCREAINIARALGAPYIKEAGIGLYKDAKSQVQKDEVIGKLYATTPDRLEQGIMTMDINKLLTID